MKKMGEKKKILIIKRNGNLEEFDPERIEKTFRQLEEELSLKGYLVFSPLVYNQSGDMPACGVERKEMLDIEAKLKINHSDLVLVVDCGGYIGKSTKDQIEHAKLLNKPVLYYSKGDL